MIFFVILAGLIWYYCSLIQDIKNIKKCNNDNLEGVTIERNNAALLRMKNYKRYASILILIISSFLIYYYITVVYVATSLFGSATDSYNRKDYAVSKQLLQQYRVDYPEGKHISEVNDMINEIDQLTALPVETKKN